MPADVDLNINIDKKGKGDEEAALGLEALAKAADDAQDQLAQLDRKLLETRAAMVGAGKTFQETGDISPLKSLLKDERQLSQVQKSISRGAEAIAKDLENAGDKGGQGFIIRFASRVENGIASLPVPQGLVQWLVAGAVAAAPLIGAAVNAGVLLVVGGGTIAAGLALAAQDYRVHAAYADLGGFIKNEFIDASTSFIGPAILAASKVKTTFAEFGPTLRAGFDAVAPSVLSLADGFDGLIKNVQGGLGHAFDAAKPVIDALAQELPGMGQAIGFFFDRIAGGKDGAVQFIHDFSQGLDVTIASLGVVIEGLSKTYNFLRNNPVGEFLVGPLSAAFDHLNEGAQHSGKTLAEYNAEGNLAAQGIEHITSATAAAGLGVEVAAGDFKSLAAQISATRATTDMLAGAMSDKLFASLIGMDQATLGVHQSLTQLGDTLKRNTVSARDHAAQLDIDTSAGQSNRSAVLQAISANVGFYDAQIKSGISAEDAAAAYDQNTQALEKQLRKAGLTQGAIDGLVGKYRSVPANVDTDIVLKGLAEAIAGLDSTLRRINGLDGKVANAYVVTHYQTTGNASVVENQGSVSVVGSGRVRAQAKGGVIAAAHGMITDSPTVLFGERGTGLEAYIPKLGISDQRGLALADQAASWHGGTVVPKSAGYGGVSAGSAGGGTMTVKLVVTADGASGDSGQQGLVDFVHYAVRMGWLQLKADPNSGYQVRAA